MRKLIIITLCLAWMLPIAAREIFPVPKGDFAPRTYTALRPCSPIIIDGRLDDESWQKTPFTEDFVDIEGEPRPKPFLQTRVKMLWDDEALYIGAEMIDPHIWGKLTQRDAVIFHDNDFEVFIDPDGDTHDYYELEINALGTVWDLFLIKPYRDRQQVAVNAWDIRELEYAVHIEGSLNDPSDTDQAWYIEMKIPMQTLQECAHKEIPPPEGDYWRVNFSRVHWITIVQDGIYHKVPTRPEYNWVWSPQGLIAMHYPERWGYLFFSHAKAGSDYVQAKIPEIETAKEYLRQLYYKQKQYEMDHGKYARNLRQLRAKKLRYRGRKVPLKIERTSQSYIITLGPTKDLPRMCIREDGLLWLP
ncbi:MAG: carbohydrate-binding family 9-like protein [Candidatus Cloacimonadaceae bacterium]|nr:carbohydrate-binding family 9-like protein [Candidatus Cloacimonadota bacterium]MDY0126724.1 carbohydrate-binding family 9-like protein [Candidatus Cloacimonadaceae bacterium]MCB5255500.1 carbohydrate-binding family 9-like protein [Candidatus Cloacimonadota bacterium]MCK9178061.1 carbohydrate-binding family 9-like protein [Candidatus Cloacimonadota bacterium]MCK9242002.1 carbohydrate-binding family 9-like protein [Candidatus Cloacimonadota bacterium]